MNFFFDLSLDGFFRQVFEVFLLETFDKRRIDFIDHFFSLNAILVHISGIWPPHDEIERNGLVGKSLTKLLKENIGFQSQYESIYEKKITLSLERTACDAQYKIPWSYSKSWTTFSSSSGIRTSSWWPFMESGSTNLAFSWRTRNASRLRNSMYWDPLTRFTSYRLTFEFILCS